MVKRASCGLLAALWWCCAAFAQEEVKLTGLVVDENGAPLAGAAVGAFGVDEFVDTAALLAGAKVRTGADGRFAIATKLQRGGTRVAVAATQRQSVLLQPPSWEPELEYDLGPVLLPPGGRLVGRVRDERGTPLAGARIRVTSSIADRWGFQQQLLAGATSDAQGIFRVLGVPRSGLRATFEADGCVGVSRLAAEEAPLDITLRRAEIVRGRVVDRDGKPVANARVSCFTEQEQDAPSLARTADDGTFAIAAPAVARFRVNAFENGPPYRTFASEQLNGGADAVEVCERAANPADGPLVVEVVDAATKAPIRAFRLAVVAAEPTNRQMVMLWGRCGLEAHQEKAFVPRGGGPGPRALLVEAEDHGFAIVGLPAGQERLVVELGPEAVLSGRVIDAVTQKPLAGVAVRALPRGSSSGGGAISRESGPVTDADGRYTIRRLAPGDYGVQAHAPTRPASPERAVTVRAGERNDLDLEVPAELWIEIDLEGEIPRHLVCVPTLGSQTIVGGVQGFQHPIRPRLPGFVSGQRLRIGPLLPAKYEVNLFLPSRTRAGTGTMVQLGAFDPEKGPHVATLPDLDLALWRGRVDLSSGLPSERIAVLAHPADHVNREPFLYTRRPCVAGVDGAGCFVLDVPRGDYIVQLADLATGIVFHTERDVLAVGERELVLHPDAHWLDVRCVPEHAGGEVSVVSFTLHLLGGRDGRLSPFLGWDGYSREATGSMTFASSVPFRAWAAYPRWLVPAGELTIEAVPTSFVRRVEAGGAGADGLEPKTLTIDKREHGVTFTIPAPLPETRSKDK